MISSMTGFGRGEVNGNEYMVSVEIRSLNHRFLDVEIRLPKNLQSFDTDVRELINRNLSRGRVSVAVTVRGGEISSGSLTIDKPLAMNYLRLLEGLKQDLNLNGPIQLEQLLALPDIFLFESNDESKSEILKALKKSVNLALEDLKGMRLREGEELCKDLAARIASIDILITNIEKCSKDNAAEIFTKLKNRVAEIANMESLNEGRLEAEVAILAEKADVTEECIRFKSHNTMFMELLDKPSSEGRKLNFLLQEMHREANTIGAKVNDAEVAHWVVEVKEEVEKLREQIQNIE